MSNVRGHIVPALAAIAVAALPLASIARPLAVFPSSPSVCNNSAIKLGPALSPFAALAGTTITNVGATVVDRSPDVSSGTTPLAASDLIGVWPGTAITGFYPPGIDEGGFRDIYAAGFDTNRAVPQAAQGALNAAYTIAAGIAPTALVAGDLSEVALPGYPTGTLPPGVYKSNSTLGIMSGNLTLDGRQGNSRGRGSYNTPPPVFVFEIASSLTTTYNAGAGGNIILINGATPCDIYWQVGDSATLGGATFYGNVFAYTSITLGASTFTGRALALNGAITMPAASGSLITNPGGR